MSGECWSALTFLVKTGLKTALNTCVMPGSGSSIDFLEAVVCLCYGDLSGAAINTLSGFADLSTLGLAGHVKEAMKRGAKSAVVQTSKEMAKSTSKEGAKTLGKKVGMGIAQGAINDVVEEVWQKGYSLAQRLSLGAISSGGDPFGTTPLKCCAEHLLHQIFLKKRCV